MSIDLRRKPETDEGVAYFTPLPGKSDRVMVVRGVKFDAADAADTDNDSTFGETREIQGAWLEVSNHQAGDFVELSLRGNLGQGEVELGKFGEMVYIPPCGKVDQIVSEGTVSIPPGFKLRMRYTAVSGGSTRTVYGWYRMRK